MGEGEEACHPQFVQQGLDVLVVLLLRGGISENVTKVNNAVFSA